MYRLADTQAGNVSEYKASVSLSAGIGGSGNFLLFHFNTLQFVPDVVEY